MGEAFANRYELLDVLGSGGMGTVWRVWDRRERQLRAAKVLQRADATSLLRFVREQGVRIQSPHVLAPLGWAGEDDTILFTMEIVRGGSLSTLVGDYGPLPRAWIAVLMDQLFAALEAVHGKGLVHRDVKPANLLLEPTGKGRPYLLLSDFGVALPTGEPRLTQDAVIVGTPGYNAPEQVAGAEPEPRQDLYSAGMVALEMLTGKSPQVSPVEALKLPEVAGDGPFAPVIRRLLALDPNDRYASATEARAALHATGLVPGPGEVPDDEGLEIDVLDQSPPLPDGFKLPSESKRWQWMSARAVSAAVAGICLVTGAVVTGNVLGSSHPPSAITIADSDSPVNTTGAGSQPAPPGTGESIAPSVPGQSVAPKGPGTSPSTSQGTTGTTSRRGPSNTSPGSGAPTSPPGAANLIVNGDFESGDGGWFSSTGDALALVDGGFASGHALRLTNTNTERKSSVINDTVNSVLGASRASDYVATAWVRTSNPGTTVGLRLMQYDRTSRSTVKEAYPYLFLQDTNWHQITAQLPTIAGNYDIDVNLLSPDLPSGATFDIDGLTLNER